jgi:hypothetical protein
MGLKNKKKFRILHGKFDDLASLQDENKKRSEGAGAKKHKNKERSEGSVSHAEEKEKSIEVVEKKVKQVEKKFPSCMEIKAACFSLRHNNTEE